LFNKIFNSHNKKITRMKQTAILAGLVLLVAFAWYWYRTPRFVAGETAPDIELNLANGQKASLSALRGQYTILQFWGSWCGPCRAENPFLVQLYDRYQSKGLAIVSIGIERNAESWQRAIQNDGLRWPAHTMESGDFDGPLARQFNIRSIPATFLLNPEGHIMGVNLRQEQLERMIREKLGQ
jgi:thiol-disulfide isomerase/thioredoxin